MNKLKLKLLTGRSGPDGSHAPGDKIDLPVKEAIALIDSNQAEPMNNKSYEIAKKKLQSIEDEEKAKEAEANAILKKKTLELELRALYEKVALKVAEIEGIVLSDDEIKAFVDEKMQGEPLKKEEEK